MLEMIMAVADRTRLQILLLLGKKGQMCVGDIAGCFKISRPAISHHLKVLKTYELVGHEKTGQEIIYSVSCGNIVRTLRALADELERCAGLETTSGQAAAIGKREGA
ncbi:MAG: winged helix-turn-helix transcriptional regulator [Acidobacteria bacterium]|nr:winged helix-turn-helix transcriptional regulator [Acidobacteriota bacterium]